MSIKYTLTKYPKYKALYGRCTNCEMQTVKTVTEGYDEARRHIEKTLKGHNCAVFREAMRILRSERSR